MVCTISAPCQIVNSTSIGDWFSYANTITGNEFGLVLIFMIFVISFVGMSAYPLKVKMPVSLFIASILGLVMRLMSALPDWAVYALFISTVASAVLLNSSKEG